MRKCWKSLLNQAKRLRVQVFLAYFLVLSVCFALLSFFIALGVRGILTNQIGASRIELLCQISERANTVKTSATTLAGLYQYELNSLKAQNASPEQMQQVLSEQIEKYNGVFIPIGMEHQLVVMSNNFFFSSLSDEIQPEYLEKQLWFRHLKRDMLDADPGSVTFSSTFRTAEDGRYQFAAAQFIDPQNTSDILMVLIDEKVIEDLYAPAVSNGSEIYVYDKNGYIVSHRDKHMLGKQFIDTAKMTELYGTNSFSMIRKLGSDYLLSTYLDPITGWTIVEEIPAQHIFGVLKQVNGIIAAILLACLCISLLIALYQSQRISKPLSQLSEAMNTFDGQNFISLPTETGTMETDKLSRSFNNMAAEITHLMETVKAQGRQKRAAEMNFLRAQINPHFLYNMLFSIRCTVEIGKTDQAVQMIAALIDLLKSTLKRTDETISLEEEFESTRKYLVVQKLRYGENVHFEMDLAPETKSCMVPPLILQPLVENAIFHGLEASDDADMIVVASELDGNDLLLTVSDDGAGMDEDTLGRVCSNITAQTTGTEKQCDSIGLANVHNRIRLNYGEQYGISISSVPHIGTTVTIRLPAQYPQNPQFMQEVQNDEGSDC